MNNKINAVILANTTVKKVVKEDSHYVLETTIGQVVAEYVIFAVGDFSFPNKSSIENGEK